MELRVKLKEVMVERNITQVQLAELTGLRQAVISELVNNQRMSVKKDHIVKICEALNIERIEDIMELKA